MGQWGVKRGKYKMPPKKIKKSKKGQRICGKHGCDKPAANSYQKYCSRECAPLGYLVDPLWNSKETLDKRLNDLKVLHSELCFTEKRSKPPVS
jgi:hypothetical protein